MAKLEEILNIIRKQEDWRNSTLNLIASENRFFPEFERELYCNDFMRRYAEGHPGKRYYNGTKYIDQLESESVQYFKDKFKVSYVDVRPISGAIANLSVFASLPRITGNVITNSLAGGGHITHNSMGTISQLTNRRVFNYPLDPDNPFKMDVDRSLHLIRKLNPDFIVLGKSMFLHPEPVEEIRKEFPDLTIVYDAAHVFGLIYGDAFQNPLKEGADILTASTHKTFPGPQGGIILSNLEEQLWKPIDKMVFPGILSNHHLHHIPALLATAILYDTKHKDYGKKVVRTAQEVAKGLAEEGFKVCGYDGKEYTYTHQIVVNVKELGGGKKVADQLEKYGIIVNKNSIPGDKSVIKPSGIRIGVQEEVLRGKSSSEILGRLVDGLRRIERTN